MSGKAEDEGTANFRESFMTKNQFGNRLIQAKQCGDLTNSVKSSDVSVSSLSSFDLSKRVELLQTSLTQVGADLIVLKERLDMVQNQIKVLINTVLLLGETATENENLKEDVWESHVKDLENLERKPLRFL